MTIGNIHFSCLLWFYSHALSCTGAIWHWKITLLLINIKIIGVKDFWVLFHMRYGSSVCSKDWLSDRPKWGATHADPSVQNRSKTMLEWCENRMCLSLSACHMTVSLRWICYHTSFERGHSGLPADIKIRTMVQLIGILWPYLGVLLGSRN